MSLEQSITINPQNPYSKKYILKKDIVFKAGESLLPAPEKIKFYSPHFEVIIGFGDDETASLFFDADLLKSFPDYFEEIKK